MMPRLDESAADSFDLELFRLISKAEQIGRLHRQHAKTWGDVARKLSSARPLVRSMMADKRRAETA